MTPEQLKAMMDEFGRDNLRAIIFDNSRALYIAPSKEIIRFDDTNEMIIMKEIKIGGEKFISIIPYASIQGLEFNTGEFVTDEELEKLRINEN